MWPFRKKPCPSINIVSFTETKWMSREEIKALGAFGINALASWETLKRQRAQEKKMKLDITAGKWYEVEGGKICQAEAHPHVAGLYLIGSSWCAGHGLPAGGAPRILREVPTPIKLEVGVLYEMSNGTVEWCREPSDAWNHQLVALGAWLYKPDGSCGSRLAPRPLHRIKLNEKPEPELYIGVDPAKDSGDMTKIFWKHRSGKSCDITSFAQRLNPGKYFDECPACRHDRLLEAVKGATADYIKVEVGESEGAGKLFSEKVKEAEGAMRHLTPTMARTLRPVLDEIIARHDASKPVPVTYKPHSDCSKREVEIPKGWELAIGQPVDSLEGMLMPKDGFWVPAVWGITEHGKTIRPKPAPFKITGPGWYRTNKGWEHLNMDALRWFKHSDSIGPFHGDTRLIARATRAQAAALDAL